MSHDDLTAEQEDAAFTAYMAASFPTTVQGSASVPRGALGIPAEASPGPPPATDAPSPGKGSEPSEDEQFTAYMERSFPQVRGG